VDVSIPQSGVYTLPHNGGPMFLTSDDSVQDGITFFIIMIQILLADIQAHLFVQDCEFF